MRISPASGMKYLNQLLSRKDVSICCFILAVCIKIFLTCAHYHVNSDKLFQAMAGKNFAEGHGLTIKQVHANNLSKEYYEPLVGWPPGYSIVFGIIYTLLKDVELTCLIIDFIFIILYFIILRKLFNQLGFPLYLNNILLLFNASLITTYMTHSTPTDLITLVLSIYGCYYSIKLFLKEKAIPDLILLAVLNCIPAWFRYMYIPVTFVIPAFFIWNGWMKKNKRLSLYGILIFAAGLVSTMALLAFQKPYGTNVGYVPIAESGIYWSNLLKLSPILFSVFINTEFYALQLSTVTGLTFVTWMQAMKWINLILVTILCGWFLFFSFRRKWLAASAWQTFVMIGGFTGLSIFGVLCYMSLTHSDHYAPPLQFIWTYVSEDRYFIFVELVILIITAKWLFVNQPVPFKPKKLLQWLFLLALLIQFLHSIYFLGKDYTFDQRNISQTTIKRRMAAYIDNAINYNKKKGIDVVVTANTTLANRSVLSGGKALFETTELNDKLHTDKPIKLIIACKGKPSSFYSPFLETHEVIEEARIGPLNFYSYFINPDTATLK